MNIVIHTIDGSTHNINTLNEMSSTGDLFLAVSKLVHHNVNQIRLVYKNKALNEWDLTQLLATDIDTSEDPIDIYQTLRMGNRTKNKELQNKNQTYECPICLEDIDLKNLFVINPCKHIICYKCCIKYAALNIKCSLCDNNVDAYVHLSACPDNLQIFFT